MTEGNNNQPAHSRSSGDDADEIIGFELLEVRYSLPEMLRELEIERRNSYFAKEIIDQVEITRMFEEARMTRAKRK